MSVLESEKFHPRPFSELRHPETSGAPSFYDSPHKSTGAPPQHPGTPIATPGEDSRGFEGFGVEILDIVFTMATKPLSR
jgi:hypothetical protein